MLLVLKNDFWLFGWSYIAIVIYENCTKNNSNYVGNGTYDIKEKYELNGGERNFAVKSFEIFMLNIRKIFIINKKSFIKKIKYIFLF